MRRIIVSTLVVMLYASISYAGAGAWTMHLTGEYAQFWARGATTSPQINETNMYGRGYASPVAVQSFYYGSDGVIAWGTPAWGTLPLTSANGVYLEAGNITASQVEDAFKRLANQKNTYTPVANYHCDVEIGNTTMRTHALNELAALNGQAWPGAHLLDGKDRMYSLTTSTRSAYANFMHFINWYNPNTTHSRGIQACVPNSVGVTRSIGATTTASQAVTLGTNVMKGVDVAFESSYKMGTAKYAFNNAGVYGNQAGIFANALLGPDTYATYMKPRLGITYAMQISDRMNTAVDYFKFGTGFVKVANGGGAWNIINSCLTPPTGNACVTDIGIVPTCKFSGAC
jgi:hypothetical protein